MFKSLGKVSLPGGVYTKGLRAQRRAKTSFMINKAGLSAIYINTLFIPNKTFGKNLHKFQYIESAFFSAQSALNPKTILKGVKSLTKLVKGVPDFAKSTSTAIKNTKDYHTYTYTLHLKMQK